MTCDQFCRREDEKISATGSFPLRASLHPFNQQLWILFFPATLQPRPQKCHQTKKLPFLHQDPIQHQQTITALKNIPCLCCLVKNEGALGLVWLPLERRRQMTLSTCALVPGWPTNSKQPPGNDFQKPKHQTYQQQVTSIIINSKTLSKSIMTLRKRCQQGDDEGLAMLTAKKSNVGSARR